MTTVAADARTGVMAADTMVSDGTMRTRMRKITRHNNALIGVAGDLAEIQTWLKWFKGGQKGSSPKLGNCFALVLTPEGLTYWCGSSVIEVDEGYQAIGTGALAAQALLVAGHTCEEAVRIACEVDANSSLPIQVESLSSNCKDSPTV